jgi:uncharacterized membrane protein HdeD (DUF308 family)
MLAALALNWPFLLIRAGLGVIAGFAILVWPEWRPTSLTLIFGMYAFSDGVLAMVVALSTRDVPGFGSLLTEAVTRTILGLMIVASPAGAEAKLVDIFTAWVWVTGISAIVIALVLRREISVSGEWPLPAAGVISLIYGITLRLAPPPPSVLPLIVGGHSLLVGLAVLALTLRLRQLSSDIAGR